jgi:hypothetical protein
MLGALWMLAWLGLAADWQRRSFWTPENLLASAFHPHSEIAADFQSGTLSGLALYLLLYSLLGAAFAILASRGNIRQPRATLLAVVMSLAWYYGSFHLVWRSVSPAIDLLQPVRSTVLGHVIYGIALGRFASHLPRYDKPVAASVAEQQSSDSLAPKV